MNTVQRPLKKDNPAQKATRGPRVVLVFPLTGLDIKGASITLPLSLLCLSAPLVEKGYEVKIIDQRLDKKWKQTLTDEIKKNPVCVGITAMTGKQIDGAILASQVVKKQAGRIPVIWGGAHASLLPRQTIDNPFVDIIVDGEGEETFAELVECLKERTDISRVKGIFYKNEGQEILKTDNRDFVDLDALPPLPYHIVNLKDYTNSMLLDVPEISHFYSRGCPYNCGFCYNKKVNKRKWRVKSPEKLIRELVDLKAAGIEAVSFADEEFFIDIQKVKDFCALIRKEKLRLKLMVSCRINDILRFDGDLLCLLEKCGFTAFYVGVESGSDRMLERINKSITKQQVLSANTKLSYYNIDVYYSFMCGFPQETLSEIKETVLLMNEMYNGNPNAYILPIKAYTPYPGTELYDLCQKEGFVPPQSLGEWSSFKWDNDNITWLDRETKKYIDLITYLTVFMDEKHVLKSKIGKRIPFLYFIAKAYAGFIRQRLSSDSLINIDVLLMRVFNALSRMHFLKTRRQACPPAKCHSS